MKYLVFVVLLALVLVAILYGVNTPKLSTVNQIQINDNNQFVLVGDKSKTLSRAYLKSPYLLVLDEDLNQREKKVFDTPTTSQNSQVILKGQKSILYNYRAGNLEHSPEYAYIDFLDENYSKDSLLHFGYRTRLEKVVELPSGLAACSYERSDRTISLTFLKSNSDKRKYNYKISPESSQPTDMVAVDSDTTLLIISLAGGYHYRDGHNYDMPKAHSVILKVNAKGEIIKRDSLVGAQNLFVNDLEKSGDRYLLTGTIQNENTGMDVLVIELSDQLDTISCTQTTQAGVQQGVKSILYKEGILTLSQGESPQFSNYICSLTFKDKLGIRKWNQSYGQKGYSYTPTDMVHHNNKIYITANRRTQREALPEAILLEIDTTGELIQEHSLFP